MPRGNNRSQDNTRAQRREQTRQAREQLADRRGVDESEVVVEGRRRGSPEARLTDEGEDQLRETVADDTDFVESDDLTVDPMGGQFDVAAVVDEDRRDDVADRVRRDVASEDRFVRGGDVDVEVTAQGVESVDIDEDAVTERQAQYLVESAPEATITDSQGEAAAQVIAQEQDIDQRIVIEDALRRSDAGDLSPRHDSATEIVRALDADAVEESLDVFGRDDRQTRPFRSRFAGDDTLADAVADADETADRRERLAEEDPDAFLDEVDVDDVERLAQDVERDQQVGIAEFRAEREARREFADEVEEETGEDLTVRDVELDGDTLRLDDDVTERVREQQRTEARQDIASDIGVDTDAVDIRDGSVAVERDALEESISRDVVADVAADPTGPTGVDTSAELGELAVDPTTEQVDVEFGGDGVRVDDEEVLFEEGASLDATPSFTDDFLEQEAVADAARLDSDLDTEDLEADLRDDGSVEVELTEDALESRTETVQLERTGVSLFETDDSGVVGLRSFLSETGSVPATTEDDRNAIDRFRQDTLQPASGTFQDRIGEPFGEAMATATPVTELDRVLPGQPVDTGMRSFGTSVADAANVPALADASLALGERAVEDAMRFGRGDRTEVVQDVATDAAGAATSLGGAFRESPFETAGTVTGSLVGGTAVATGVLRSARQLDTRVGATDGSPFDGLPGGTDIVTDTRAQAGFGRSRRSDSDTDQEQVQITRELEEGESPTQSTSEWVESRTQRTSDTDVDLETEIRQMAEEADTMTSRQRTPRQRAEQRVPSADEFATPAAQQREILRLEQRFRQADMTDLRGRAVPATPGMDATTVGRYGTDLAAGTTVAGAQTMAELASPPAGALEAEPVATAAREDLVPAMTEFTQDQEVTAQTEMGLSEASAPTELATSTVADVGAVTDSTVTSTTGADTTTFGISGATQPSQTAQGASLGIESAVGQATGAQQAIGPQQAFQTQQGVQQGLQTQQAAQSAATSTTLTRTGAPPRLPDFSDYGDDESDALPDEEFLEETFENAIASVESFEDQMDDFLGR